MSQLLQLWVLLSLTLVASQVQSGSSPCLLENNTLDCRQRQLTKIPHIPPGVTTLLLDNNNIETIAEGDFNEGGSLETLSLSYNRLRHLPVNSFQGLKKLSRLYLGHNALCLGNESYPEGLFKPLTSLRVLNIASNGCRAPFSEFYPDEALKDLKNLETLALTGLKASSNPLGSGFSELTNLQTLMFIGDGNRMGSLPCDFFTPLQNISLKRLSLRNGGIQYLCETVFQPLKSLSYLNVACNKQLEYDYLKNALFGLPSASLQTLSMDAIGYYDGEVGQYNYYGLDHSSLKNLRRISMKQIGEVYFDAVTLETITRAEVIVLGHSNILLDYSDKDLPRKFATMLDKSNLITISMPYFNDPKYPVDTLEAEMCSPSDIDLEDFIFFPMKDPYTPKNPELSGGVSSGPASTANPIKEMETLDIDDHLGISPIKSTVPILSMKPFNHPLSAFEVQLFKFFPKTARALYLNNCQPEVIKNIFELEVNPSNGVKFLNLSTMSSEPETKVFNNLKKFPNMSMLEAQLCQISGIDDTFPIMNKLVSLNLDNNMLTELDQPFKNFPNIETISLQSNKISSISKDTFSGLARLKNLLLNHNFISSTYLNVKDSDNLQVLDLAFNKIQYLTEKFFGDLNRYPTLNLNLDDNKFVCDCHAFPFVEWLQTTNITIEDKWNLTCLFKDNISTPIIDIELDAYRISCYKWLLPLVIALATGFVITAAAFVAYVKRWALRLAYYRTKRKLRPFCKRLRSHLGLLTYSQLCELNHGINFTAYVVYDNADYDWVTDEFVEKVEDEWNFKLAFAGRDCTPGEPNSKVVDIIDSSKLVICLLSPGFAVSNLCMFELQLGLDRGEDKVIFVELQRIPFDLAPNKLRAIVYDGRDNKNFLEFTSNAEGQTLFWNQLRERLTNL